MIRLNPTDRYERITSFGSGVRDEVLQLSLLSATSNIYPDEIGRGRTFRTLLPPYARPELQSSRLAHIWTLLPSSLVKLGRYCIGDGPN